MNQGKIWRVVNPTVGVPLFLTAVAVSSFMVHYMLYTHTTWLPAYHQGGSKAAAPKAADASTLLAPTTTAQAATTTKQ
jgi:light-harvesting protein B-800-850 alpha chain